MAKAVRRPVSEYEIVLTLSVQEAEAIRRVFHKVAGHPSSTRRLYTANVNNALEEAGVGMGRADTSGYITFEDYRY